MKRIEFAKRDNRTSSLAVDTPTECPLCHLGIEPKTLSVQTYWYDNKERVSVLYECLHCGRTFMSLSNITGNDEFINGIVVLETDLEYVGPSFHSDTHFDDKIEALSPHFVKIYNQAAAAESFNLDEIAGLGYRKSIEFLTKDFCIHKHPDDIDRIKSMFLSDCIRKCIDNPKIGTLATTATWIGNDETHYVRRIDGRTIEDMKAFIQAMVYYIGMDLVLEDALSMSPG